ncbi:MAG: ATP-dependent metallopeptidase FtsH/Yme1/Tma family protein, partial [Spirochaetaceae bacterium]|nr:ATP-dependent metallopeptidase FtsH/Yme1/Tma family protein [Spirochaetaceae bacterium]
MDNKQNDPKNPMNFNFGNNRFALVFLVVLMTMFILFFFFSDKNVDTEISYSEFLQYVANGDVREVKIVDQHEIQGRMSGRMGEGMVFKTSIPYYDEKLVPRLLEKGVQVSGGMKAVSPLRIMLEFVPWFIGFFFIWFMFRQFQGGGNKAFSFGRSRAKRYSDNGKKTTFADV